MGLDTNIAMGGQQVQLADPMALYAKGAAIQNSMQQNQLNQLAMEKHQQELASDRTLAELYRNSMNPDGSIDRNKVLSSAAQQGLGAKIPGLQKSFMDVDKVQGEIKEKKVVTDKHIQELTYNGLKHLDTALSSLLAKPDVDDRAVYSEVGRLVRLGAFDGPAQHMGVSPDDAARQFMSTMPLGNPTELRKWLLQAGMRAMDSSERIKLQLPKYDEQDRGGSINQGTLDPLTGLRTEGVNIDKTNTPGEVLQANTTRRGQNMVDGRAADANAIAKEAASSQVVETPQGYAVINKGAADSRFVRGEGGQPVLGKDSAVMKNTQMAQRLTGMIPYAKQLLTGIDATGRRSGDSATSSGVGAVVDKLNSTMGIGTKSGDAATALETVAGWMTSNVPRFEGPQSDKDTAVYRTMAGTVGDRSLPMSTRLKAMEAVETLMNTYKVDPTSDRMVYVGPPGTQPATMIAPRPAVPVRGGSAARSGSSPMRGGAPAPAPAAPAAAPSIDSFFR